ncbi:ABC transporter ATP-binding protein [Paenibacillus piri]|uniref:Carnitine transport ATP-binding protein OpuCA n=1 Tax=Paenibacillus piri TaxID=2547395 RepID=A0A4R5K9T1_9BACL|nr:ABC transporter ATP-binding protein [Paenibacillus piri]TDF90087.1 ABC transporter ATP-binding protein [Paenibacillus piri]
MSFVEIQNLTFSYSGTSNIIDNFSFCMDKGEIVGILGPSGRGKSTLLRLIAGLESPLKGSIVISGKTVLDAATYIPPEKRSVGMVFQDYALFPHLNVSKNIQFGLHRLSGSERAKRVQEMLELVQLRDYEKRYPHELSGGQQQRVALARALAPQPIILLMDEPFSNLDADLKEHIRGELGNILRKAGITCLFVTHDQRDVEAICDRVFTMV